MANTKARKITYDGQPVQVESAVRDGTGKTISSTYSTKAETVTNVSYNSTSKKIQKTINGTTSDVVTLATVATSGSYNDLSNKPTIPAAANNGTFNIQSDGTTVQSFTANATGTTNMNFVSGVGITHDRDTTNKKITTKLSGEIVQIDLTNTTAKTTTTYDLNTYNCSAGTIHGYELAERITGNSSEFTGAYGVANRPNNVNVAFTVSVRLTRWASSSDYTTRQILWATGNSAFWYRWCTNGTWSSWTGTTLADTKVTQNLDESYTTGQPIVYPGASNGTAGPVNYTSKLLVTPSSGYLTGVGATFSGTVDLTRTTDVQGTGTNAPALRIGAVNGQHLEFDGNEIMSKATKNTVGTLNLNIEGGSVVIGSAPTGGTQVTVANGAISGTTFNGLTLTKADTGFAIAGGTTSKQLTLDADLTASAVVTTSSAAASGGTTLSLVTTGEKYTWNNKSNLAIGTTASTAAAGNHVHGNIANDGSISTNKGNVVITNSSTGKLEASSYSIAKSVPSNAVFTDVSCTAVGNHYAPATDSSAALSASASGATAAWSIDVVKGVTISRDAKGHVTGVSVTSGKIPANPNTDTKVAQTLKTDNYDRPLLMSDQITSTTTVDVVGEARRNNSIYANTSTGILTAPSFKGFLRGGNAKQFTFYGIDSFRTTTVSGGDTVVLNQTNNAYWRICSITKDQYLVNNRSWHAKIHFVCWNTVNTRYTNDGHTETVLCNIPIRHEFVAEINCTKTGCNLHVLNNTDTGRASGIYGIRLLVPKNDSYGCQLELYKWQSTTTTVGDDFKGAGTDCQVYATVLEDDVGLTWENNADNKPTATSYNSNNYNNSTLNIGQYNENYSSHKYNINIRGTCDGRSGSTWDNIYHDRLQTGSTTPTGFSYPCPSAHMVGVADDGCAYTLAADVGTKAFGLPFNGGYADGNSGVNDTTVTVWKNGRGFDFKAVFITNMGFQVKKYVTDTYKGTKTAYSNLPTSGNTVGDIWQLSGTSGSSNLLYHNPYAHTWWYPSGSDTTPPTGSYIVRPTPYVRWNGSRWDLVPESGDSLYIVGSLNAGGNFVVDSPKTLVTDTSGGHTFLKVGEMDSYYDTSSVSRRFTIKCISCKAYTFDSSNKLTHIDGKSIAEGTGKQLTNVPVTFSLQATPDYADYPYRGVLTDPVITPNTYATVTYSSEQAASGNFSPICNTGSGVLYVYANAAVGSITIPTITISGGELSMMTIDATPTSGSGNPVSSGGVYSNCVRTTDDQAVYGIKYFKGNTPTSQPPDGGTTVPMGLDFYGGTTVGGVAYGNYLDIPIRNKDSQLLGIISAFQVGTDNSNGFNGFRFGLRDRADTTWKAFLSIYNSGSIGWDGYIYQRNGQTRVLDVADLEIKTSFINKGNITGHVTFTRIGPSLARIDFSLSNGSSVETTEYILTNTDLANLFGYTVKAPGSGTAEVFNGWWTVSTFQGVVSSDKLGYGAPLGVSSSGIRIGRWYNLNPTPQWGGWAVSAAQGHISGSCMIGLV